MPTDGDNSNDFHKSSRFQFGLSSLFVLTFWVSVAGSLLRTLGADAAPCVAGLAGVWIGFFATVRVKYDRLYYISLFYLVGCIVGVYIMFGLQASNAMGAREWPDGFNVLLSILGMAIPILSVAGWYLRKARRRTAGQRPDPMQPQSTAPPERAHDDESRAGTECERTSAEPLLPSSGFAAGLNRSDGCTSAPSPATSPHNTAAS
jgi:hypothetical protein